MAKKLASKTEAVCMALLIPAVIVGTIAVKIGILVLIVYIVVRVLRAMGVL